MGRDSSRENQGGIDLEFLLTFFRPAVCYPAPSARSYRLVVVVGSDRPHPRPNRTGADKRSCPDVEGLSTKREPVRLLVTTDRLGSRGLRPLHPLRLLVYSGCTPWSIQGVLLCLLSWLIYRRSTRPRRR